MASKSQAHGADKPGRHHPDLFLMSIAKAIGREWRQLGIHLGLSNSCISHLEDELLVKGHEYTVFEMLVRWKQGLSSDTDGYQLLASCLCELNRSDLADKVENNRKQPSESNGAHPASISEEKRKTITETLKNIYGKYRMPNTSNGGVNFNFVDLYTEPIVKGRKGGLPIRFESHLDLLDMRNSDGNLQYKRVLLRGPPGCGKTTLFKALSYSWYRLSDSLDSVTNRYDLLLSVDLTRVRDDDELADVVLRDLPIDCGISRHDLKLYIEEGPERVAVLIDGLDQLTCCGNKVGPETVPEYFLKLILQRVLGNSLVIVASRTLMKRLVDEGSYQIVDLQGFTQEGVFSYVQKFFRAREMDAQFLREVIEGYSSDLKDFLTNPNFLRWLCVLLRPGGEGFPKRLPELYDCILDDMIQRYSEGVCLSGNGRVSYFFKSILKLVDVRGLLPPFHNPVPVRMENSRRVICDIGKVAAQGLLAERERHVFEESDFSRIKDSLAAARSLGIIVQDEEVSTMVRFCHRSFQEYCAGKYCQKLGTNKPAKFRKKFGFVYDKIRSGRELINMCRFCCGGSTDSTDLIMKYILPLMVEKNMYIGTSLEGRVALSCHTECPSDTFRSLLQPHLIHEGAIQMEYPCTGSRFLKDMCHFLNGASEDAHFKNELLGVHTLAIRCGLNTYCFQTLEKMVQHFRDLQSLSLVNNPDQAADVQTEREAANHPACCLLSKLHKQHRLTQLTINNCKLTSGCLTLLMRKLSGLEYLDVSNNQSIDWSESLRLREIQGLPRLSVLKVEQSGLSKDDVGGFLCLLQLQADLVELNLDHNELNTAGLRCILYELYRMQRLEKISARRDVQDAMILPHAEIIEMITSCSKLKMVDVDKWELMNEAAGVQIIDAARNSGGLRLVFNERTINVDETGKISLFEL